MPAQSPTLSPTLSAMTAGLRGSSSGMPASTLPTRSAPTSAALVKMPPPRRANTEISEQPKASPISAAIDLRLDRRCSLEHDRRSSRVTANSPSPTTSRPGDRAPLEGEFERRPEAAARGFGRADVGAHRHEHADETRRAREHRADRKADRGFPAQRLRSDTKMTMNRMTATMPTVVYWRLRNAIAPSWMAAAIACITSLPAGWLNTTRSDTSRTGLRESRPRGPDGSRVCGSTIILTREHKTTSNSSIECERFCLSISRFPPFLMLLCGAGDRRAVTRFAARASSCIFALCKTPHRRPRRFAGAWSRLTF